MVAGSCGIAVKPSKLFQTDLAKRLVLRCVFAGRRTKAHRVFSDRLGWSEANSLMVRQFGIVGKCRQFAGATVTLFRFAEQKPESFLKTFFAPWRQKSPLIEFDAAAWRQLKYVRTIDALQAFAGGSVFFCVVARISSDSRGQN